MFTENRVPIGSKQGRSVVVTVLTYAGTLITVLVLSIMTPIALPIPRFNMEFVRVTAAMPTPPPAPAIKQTPKKVVSDLNIPPLVAPPTITPETPREPFVPTTPEDKGVVNGDPGPELTPAAPQPPPVIVEKPQEPLVVGGNIKAPTKTRNVAPVYPAIAQSARVSGVVIIQATIDTEGNVYDVKILRSIPLLDEAAITAVKQWKFSPTLLNDKPVPVIMTVTVNFALN